MNSAAHKIANANSARRLKPLAVGVGFVLQVGTDLLNVMAAPPGTGHRLPHSANGAAAPAAPQSKGR